MKLGIYGGTFNPIHIGHLQIVKEFIRRLKLDKLLLIPTATPPHKEAKNLASAEQRLAMCRLAVQEVAKADVSDMEIKRGGRSYTADTLKNLQETYPQAELFLLMGEDMFLTVQDWKNPQEIFALATIVTTPRSHSIEIIRRHEKFLTQTFHACVRIEEIPYLPVSSTQIREFIRQKKEIGHLLPSTVAEYIQRHQIYAG